MQTSQVMIEDFFNNYGKVSDTFDPEKIANFFHIPSMICNKEKVYLLTSKKNLVESLQELVLKQKENGYHHSQFTIITFIDVDSERILTSLEWAFFNAQNAMIHKCRSTYNLIKSDSVWKIVLLME